MLIVIPTRDDNSTEWVLYAELDGESLGKFAWVFPGQSAVREASIKEAKRLKVDRVQIDWCGLQSKAKSEIIEINQR